MPKQKNSSAAKKRFVVMPSGKVKRGHQNKRHLLTCKETGRKRNLRRVAYISPSFDKTVRTLING